MGKNKRIDTGRAIAGTAAPAAAAAAGEPVKLEFSREQIEAAAKAAHEANRHYCDNIGDSSQVPWDQAPEWQKASAIQGVIYAIDHHFPNGKAMHENWMEGKLAQGWVYGEKKNGDLAVGPLTHPCLVPYEQLPLDQQVKDDLFRETIINVLMPPATGGLAQLPVAGEPGSIENPLPPEQLPGAGEAEGAAADPNAATAEDVLDLDNPEDGDPDIVHGSHVYHREWNLCLSLAFAGTGLDMLTDWGNVPAIMAIFVGEHPEAPDEAVLIHVRRTLKVAVLPNEDKRRAFLAVKLFRTFLGGLARIEREDAEAARVAALQADAASWVPRIDPEDQALERERGPFDEISDLGKSPSQKAD
jgi:hypothetical protein